MGKKGHIFRFHCKKDNTLRAHVTCCCAKKRKGLVKIELLSAASLLKVYVCYLSAAAKTSFVVLHVGVVGNFASAAAAHAMFTMSLNSAGSTVPGGVPTISSSFASTSGLQRDDAVSWPASSTLETNFFRVSLAAASLGFPHVVAVVAPLPTSTTLFL